MRDSRIESRHTPFNSASLEKQEQFKKDTNKKINAMQGWICGVHPRRDSRIPHQTANYGWHRINGRDTMHLSCIHTSFGILGTKSVNHIISWAQIQRGSEYIPLILCLKHQNLHKPSEQLCSPKDYRADNLKIKMIQIKYMHDTKHIESPPLSDEEIRDIEDFYNHPEDRKVVTLEELLEELHSD